MVMMAGIIAPPHAGPPKPGNPDAITIPVVRIPGIGAVNGLVVAVAPKSVDDMNSSLLHFLREQGHSNSVAKKMLKSGKVRLNGVPTADGGRIVNPDDVRLLHNSPRMTVGRDPVILHRDSGFVVVWKPGNYLSVPARNRRKEYSVISFVHRLFGRSLPVHRLDEGR